MAQLLENGLPVSLIMDALKGPLVITQGEGSNPGQTKIIR
jgi:hypothetical protein